MVSEGACAYIFREIIDKSVRITKHCFFILYDINGFYFFFAKWNAIPFPSSNCSCCSSIPWIWYLLLMPVSVVRTRDSFWIEKVPFSNAPFGKVNWYEESGNI